MADNKKDVKLIKAMADEALSKIVKTEDKTSTPANQLITAANALIKAIAQLDKIGKLTTYNFYFSY